MTEKIYLYPNSKKIAYTIEGEEQETLLIYLHGLLSSRQSQKGQLLKQYAKNKNYGFLSLDYTAHGQSDGKPHEFAVGQCLEDILNVLENEAQNKKLIIIGSSLGGWLSLLLAERKKEQVQGVITLSCAADFLKGVWADMLTQEMKENLKNGTIIGPTEETKGYCFTYKMFQDAEKYYLLNRKIKYNGPVLLVHGDKDELIPYQTSLLVKDSLESRNVEVLIKKGEGHLLENLNLENTIDYFVQSQKDKTK